MIVKNELSIRSMTEDDFDVMLKWLNNREVLKFYGETPSNREQMMIDFLSDKKGISKILLDVKRNNYRAFHVIKNAVLRKLKHFKSYLKFCHSF